MRPEQLKFFPKQVLEKWWFLPQFTISPNGCPSNPGWSRLIFPMCSIITWIRCRMPSVNPILFPRNEQCRWFAKKEQIPGDRQSVADQLPEWSEPDRSQNRLAFRILSISIWEERAPMFLDIQDIMVPISPSGGRCQDYWHTSLKIETVAAGGGIHLPSGERIVQVGPQSSGASRSGMLWFWRSALPDRCEPVAWSFISG